jgi:hypothetical protein
MALGNEDWRIKYLAIPFSVLGFLLTLVAIGLAIAQFVVQLGNNTTVSYGQKATFKADASHVDAPVMTLCGPQPFRTAVTRCLKYSNGIYPVVRNPQQLRTVEDGRTSIVRHKLLYGLSDCNASAFERPYHETIVFHSIDSSKQCDLAYCTPNVDMDEDEKCEEVDKTEDNPYGCRLRVPGEGTNDARFCVSFSKESLPQQLGSGEATRLFFELEYLTETDYEQYTLRLWQPLEVVTPRQAAAKLRVNPDLLFAGQTLTLPYSVPATALFSGWTPPFSGPTSFFPYVPPWRDSKVYGPTSVRAGISAVIKMIETGYQTLDQEKPTWSYTVQLQTVQPEVQYPLTDSSIFVTLAFQWDSDVSGFYQEGLAVSNVGMAALLITTICTVIMAAVGRSMVDVWLTLEENPS